MFLWPGALLAGQDGKTVARQISGADNVMDAGSHWADVPGSQREWGAVSLNLRSENSGGSLIDP